MKKRCLSFFLILCLCLLLSAPFASAADELFFVAVNDTVPLTLSAEEKPYSAATGVYVPYTVFNASPGGVSVGYNTTTQTLILFSAQKRLVFSINKGTCTDEKENVTEVLTTYKNGRLYIPINICTSHFGLSYSILTSQDGYTVLRFTNGKQVYDDTLFMEKAENLISYRVESQQNTPAQTDASQQKPNAQEEEKTPVCLLICDAAQMESALAELKRQNVLAAFFLTGDEISQNPDLVRKIYAQGHTVGIAVEDTAPDPQAAAQQANEKLDALLHYKSLLVLASAEQKAQMQGFFVYEKPAYVQSLAALTRYQTTQLLVLQSRAAQTLQSADAEGARWTLLRENTR